MLWLGVGHTAQPMITTVGLALAMRSINCPTCQAYTRRVRLTTLPDVSGLHTEYQLPDVSGLHPCQAYARRALTYWLTLYYVTFWLYDTGSAAVGYG